MTDEQQIDEPAIDQAPTPPAQDAVRVGPVPSKPRRSQVSEPVPHTNGSDAPTSSRAVEGEVIPPGHLELVEQGARDVTVQSLSIRQGGVNNATADSIDIRQGGITRAEAQDISVVQGGIAIARGERISVGMGGIGLAVGGDVNISRGFARTVIARDVHIEQAGARTVFASRATFDKSSGALVVFAAKAEGNVRTLLDWRGALAFGAAFGLLVGIARRVRR
jgi:hypothetical protein